MKFKLNLITPNTKNRIHSQFNNLRMIGQFGDTPNVLLNPADAHSRNVADGDFVRVFNDRGSLELTVRIDNGIKQGCVYVTNGWWIGTGGSVNFCSLGRETDMGYGAAFHDVLVEIEPA
jgi:anaerobic selenocysteine-containing dehydrogenase